MKKVLVIGRQSAGEKNDAIVLAKAIDRASDRLLVTGAYFEDVVIVSETGRTDILIHGKMSKTEIGEFDTIILINWSFNRLYTDIAHAIAYVAHRKSVAVWNSELINARSSTKVSQLVRLSYEVVEVPTTVYSLTLALQEEYIHKVGEPFIAKDPLASRGRSNYLLSDWSECASKVDPTATYLIQSYIPNDKSDIRLLIAGGNAVLAIKRYGEGEGHLNNVSQGGRAELIPLAELPVAVLSQANMIAAHFQKDLSGIDFMEDKQTGGYVFLEINTTPQIVNGMYVNEKATAIARVLER